MATCSKQKQQHTHVQPNDQCPCDQTFLLLSQHQSLLRRLFLAAGNWPGRNAYRSDAVAVATARLSQPAHYKEHYKAVTCSKIGPSLGIKDLMVAD